MSKSKHNELAVAFVARKLEVPFATSVARIPPATRLRGAERVRSGLGSLQTSFSHRNDRVVKSSITANATVLELDDGLCFSSQHAADWAWSTPGLVSSAAN